MFDKEKYLNRTNYIMAMSDIVTGIDLDYNYEMDKYSEPKNEVTVFQYLKNNLPFDGVLFAKPNISKKREAEIKAAGGFKTYYEIPEHIATMGDCGAPNYFDLDVPNLTAEELLDYYESLGFDFGISLDHMIDTVDLTNSKKPSEKHIFRREFSIKNAIKMLEMVKDKKSNVYLMGSVQGWSPESYKQSLIELGEAGYKYVAFGGLTKYKKGIAISIMSYLKPVLKKYDFRCHLLGFGDLSSLGSLKKILNVTSIDNTTPLRNAANAPIYSWFRGKKKYDSIYLPIFKPVISNSIKKINADNNSTASQIIRGLTEGKTPLEIAAEVGTSEGYIDTVKKKFSKRLSNKILNKTEVLKEKFEDLDKLSAKAMTALLKYDETNEGLNDCIKMIRDFEMGYRKLFNISVQDVNRYLTNVSKILTDKRWKTCDCKACKEYSINTQVYRATQRHKIRAVHNLVNYYDYFKHENTKKRKIEKFIIY